MYTNTMEIADDKGPMRASSTIMCCRGVWLSGFSGFSKEQVITYARGQIESLHKAHYACILCLTRPDTQQEAQEALAELGFQTTEKGFDTYMPGKYGHNLRLWWYDLAWGVPEIKKEGKSNAKSAN